MNNNITNQLKAIIVFEFLNLYNTLENTIRFEFEKVLATLEKDDIYELHFIRGGLIGVFVEYKSPLTLKLRENAFDSNTKFKELTINQIIKINKSKEYVKSLTLEITSVQTKTNYLIEDCVLKLINMRNNLAHNIKNCNFKEKDYIEILSSHKINTLDYDFLKNYDLSLLDDMTKYVLSNLFYMEKIIEKLISK
ncbi:hypothetical protein [Aliarcobacter butzleri]|uniref:hypothetical protein n=1 Tax=Aliarcobacter butzleri TaxID=28197 RepID=UPI003AFA8F15